MKQRTDPVDWAEPEFDLDIVFAKSPPRKPRPRARDPGEADPRPTTNPKEKEHIEDG